MKKMLLTALLGLGLVLASGQQVSAWSKFNFSTGININWEGGGNDVLWGLFKGQQPPMCGMPGMDAMAACPADAALPVEPLLPLAPAHPAPAQPPQNAPRPLPQQLMPKIDAHQPVSYRPEQQVQQQQQESDYYAPSYWYGR